MTAPVCFVDTETTGLDADFHEIWEVGLILPSGDERSWLLPVDLGRADPFALKIGGFHDRHPQGNKKLWRPEFADGGGLRSNGGPRCKPLVDFAADFCALTQGLHLAGAVVSFDEERLRHLCKANGSLPEWHYHLIDVENLAAGYIANLHLAHPDGSPVADPPWDSERLSTAVGVEPDRFERHTALGDARWAKAIYEAVLGSD